MYRNNLHIDQSVKLNHYTIDSPLPHPITYHLYPQNRQEHIPNDTIKNTPLFQSQASQIANMEEGFRRIKNQQMDKLKNLKSQYEQIRNMRTDYEGPKIVQNSSLRSSRQMIEPQLISAQDSKAKLNNYTYMGRQTQILQLQKKQLEIMIQNSMKKIEELLHNQMQYKRTIHQLRINQQSKNINETDTSNLHKTIKKKQKDFVEQIRMFEIERENLLANIGNFRDKVKYLETSLINSQQQLRKMLEEKRNYEEIIRMEKDKYMNLQIQYRRQKKYNQIIQKDKESQINFLLKNKDMKQAISQKELRTQIANLQQELKVRQKRYNLLLQQFQTFKKEKTKEQKDQQVKIFNELLNKTNTQNPNKFMQETLSSILQRLSELQNKPTQHKDIESLQNYMKQTKENEGSQLLNQNYNLQRRISQYQNEVIILESNIKQSSQQNQRLKLQKQNLKKKYKTVCQSEQNLQIQIQTLKEQLKMTKLESAELNKVGKGFKSQTQIIDQSTTINYLNSKINNLQNQIQRLTKDIEQIRNQRDKVEDQNRTLLSHISKLEFQVQKTKKQAEFKASMVQKQHQSTLTNLTEDLNQFKDLFNKSNYEINQLKNQLQITNQSSKQEINRLKNIIESLQKNKNTYDIDMKKTYNQQIQRIKKQHFVQLQELASNVQNISLINRRLQEQMQKNRILQDQNIELREVVKATRWNISQNNALWSNKEAEYMNAASIISGMKMQ